MPSNKILPIAVGLVMIIAIFIGLQSWNNNENPDAKLDGVPTVNTPDVDSPADTLRSLTAEVSLMKKKSNELNNQNELLLKQKEAITRDLETKLRQELKDNPDKESHLNVMVGELSKQLDFFKSRMDDLNATQEQLSASDIPVGFGLEDGGIPNSKPQGIWIEPLGVEYDKQGNVVNAVKDNLTDSLLHGNDKESITGQIVSDTKKIITETEKPIYTVPRNSTLIGSTSMTALIGRIPLGNVVQEPFPFKVIVGKDNLATNGIDMPFLDGMIFSGTSSGDWTLSCVRGKVHSVTYVFTDGTVRTLSSDEKGNGNRKGKSSSSSFISDQDNRPLGWISDRRGIPCVAGKRISNASDFIAGRILASAASAAASAFAQNEVTTTVSGIQGTSTSSITGDAVKNAGYNALSGGADEVADYIEERGAQSFDVIYVDTGVELAIHVDVELPIDYEKNGRKTNYDNQNTINQYLD
jgi:integrating conjugative element protein (TIGR03752 family)